MTMIPLVICYIQFSLDLAALGALHSILPGARVVSQTFLSPCHCLFVGVAAATPRRRLAQYSASWFSSTRPRLRPLLSCGVRSILKRKKPLKVWLSRGSVDIQVREPSLKGLGFLSMLPHRQSHFTCLADALQHYLLNPKNIIAAKPTPITTASTISTFKIIVLDFLAIRMGFSKK